MTALRRFSSSSSFVLARFRTSYTARRGVILGASAPTTLIGVSRRHTPILVLKSHYAPRPRDCGALL
jgi:hypothetical protein